MADPQTTKLAPRPWAIEPSTIGFHWTDSIDIIDANGGCVAVLTRGYQGDDNGDGCPSFENAKLIVEAVNAYKD